MKTIDTLFENNNQNKFSFLLIAKDGMDHNTVSVLEEKLKEKINVVTVKSSKLTIDELNYAVQKSNFVITGIGRTLEIVLENKIPALIDAGVNTIVQEYPSFIDFFDPFRNEQTKPYYTKKELDLFLQEVYTQLDKHKIDYVNYM